MKKLHLLAAVSLAALAACTCKPENPFSPTSSVYQAQVLQHSRRAQQLESGTVAFFGDSQTVGFALSNFPFKTENFGINGDVINGLIGRLPTHNLPGRVVIEIGINDFGDNKLNNFDQKYQKLLDEIPQPVRVVAVAIFPINSKSTDYYKKNANHSIRLANGQIQAACAAHTGCQFLDLTAALSDSHGDLVPEYGQYDGLHMTPQGYAVWRSALVKLLGEKQ